MRYVKIFCGLLFTFFISQSCSLIKKDHDRNAIVLKDSIKINNDSSLYWYEYSKPFGHNSVSYIQVDNSFCNLDSRKALITGDLIMGIDTVIDDKIKFICADTFSVLQSSSYRTILIPYNYKSVHAIKLRINKPFFIADSCK